METKPNLETFVEDILKEKAFQNIDTAVEAQLKEDLLGRIDDAINRALIDELSDEKVSEFESLLDGGANKDELQMFLEKNINNVEAVVTAALLKFRGLYLGA